MRTLALIAVAAGMFFTGPASAIEHADTCGDYTSIDVDETVTEMGNNVRFMNFRSTTQMVAAEESKYAQLSGQCTGGAVLYGDGTVEAEGLCAVQDIEGDVLAYAFTQGRGAKEGKYVRKGGTGKFNKSRETGWYKASSFKDDITKGQWGGKDACK